MTTEISKATNPKLSIDVLRSQLSTKQRNMISDDTVEELAKLAEDPDYGEEFLDTYRDHLNILSSNSKYTSKGYMSAVKFFSLMEAGNSITDSYITVFPERFKARVDRGQEKKDITGEASRYNATALVNEIRKVATIPVQLIHRHLLHEAILEQADIMRHGKSEFVRQKASEVLIKELKPLEENVISIQVEDGAKSAIASLQEATERLVVREQQSIQAGIPIKSIIEAKIVNKVVDEDETAYDDEDFPEDGEFEDITLDKEEPTLSPEPVKVVQNTESIKPGEWTF